MVVLTPLLRGTVVGYMLREERRSGEEVVRRIEMWGKGRGGRKIESKQRLPSCCPSVDDDGDVEERNDERVQGAGGSGCRCRSWPAPLHLWAESSRAELRLVGVAESAGKAASECVVELSITFELCSFNPQSSSSSSSPRTATAMDPLFSGSIARQRNINLGGAIAGPSSSTQLAAQARSSRQARDALRRNHQSATRIQSHWRGSNDRAAVRQQRRQAFVEALEDPHRLVEATRYLSAILGKGFATARVRSQWAAIDEGLVKQWCLRVAQQVEQPSSSQSPPQTILSATLDVSPITFATHAKFVIGQMGQRLIHQASAVGVEEQSAYLAVLGIILSPTKVNAQKHLATAIVDSDPFRVIAAVLQALPTNRKGPAVIAEQAVSLILAPFALAGASSDAHSRNFVVSLFTRSILSIPSLPNRLPVQLFARLAASFPLDEVTASISAQAAPTASVESDPAAVHALANLLAMGSQRVPLFKAGKSLSDYLTALTHLQNVVDPAVFSPPAPVADDLIGAETRKRLAILHSAKHLAAVLACSNKYPSTTRPSLYTFLCSTLAVWPAETKTAVLNAILYSETASSASSGSASAAGAQGPIRELWRGYTRSSPLARKLAGISASKSDASLFRQPVEGWASLVLLAELYSRLLLTLGDDEFFPPRQGASQPAAASASSGGITLASSSSSSSSSTPSIRAHNPLTMDEVSSLTALVRNLAFTLYWHLDVTPGGAQSQQQQVPGLRYSFVALRDLATRLLQQVHARDARHRFTADDFWLMTDEMDMEGFIESVMLEEEKLAEEQAERETAAAAAATTNSTAVAGAAMEDDLFDEEMAPLEATLGRSSTTASRATSSRKFISARKMALISPRLGILNNLPFVIPFTTRIQIFRAFIYRDAVRLRLDRNSTIGGYNRRRRATVRRDHVAEDGMAQLNGLGAQLKESIEIVFMDQFGLEEAGIDGGGVFKEFLTSLVREAFDTDRGLWRATEQQEIYPNPARYARQSEQLQWYGFLGRVLGKALYEGILVDVRFASFFLSKWLGARRGLTHLDDLASLDSFDSDLYRGLIYLKNYTGDVESDLSLNFTVTDEEFGERTVHELVPGGANVAVTNKNRLSYIFLVANYRLEAQIRAQSNAFFAGLSELIDPRWLSIFDQQELSRLIRGSEDPIDISDLRANTVYSEYHEKDLTITYFWQVLEEFGQEERAALLKFVTSCPSPPLLGFAQLNPKFCIRLSGEDEGRLPTSSTCVNLLKLPRYSSLERCREKLLTAVRSGAGFDLS